MQGKRWVFTHQEPGVTDHFLHMFEGAEAGGFGYEKAPTTGRAHMQGWVTFPSNKRLSALKELCDECHFEKMKGDEVQSFTYCSKEGFYYAFGRAPHVKSQGERSDLAGAIEAFKEGGKKRACEEHPESMARYHKGVAYVVEAQVPPFKLPPLPSLRDWQADLFITLNTPADDRTIYWVRDSEGGKGKSAFVRHLISTCNAIPLEGKVSDMAYNYNGESIVCFDLTRAQAEVSDHLYTMAEKLKNGFIISTKYEVKLKSFKPPHVVFFANKDCPAGVFSADRVKLIDLD